MEHDKPDNLQSPDDATLVEDGKTLREELTLVEQKSSAAPLGTLTSPLLLNNFKDFTIVKEFPAKGAEADIHLIKQGTNEFILKLYRKGLAPGIDVLKKAQHLSTAFPEHIISIKDYGLDQNSGRWYEIQEYAKYGSLKDYFKNKPDENLLRDIIVEISEALRALHNNDIIHRDLKPSNILVRSIDPIVLVFTDFGVSSLIEHDHSKKFTTVKGTPMYWAPEAFTGVIGPKADWWSFGMIILELLLGKHPFSALDVNVIMYTLATNGVVIPNNIPQGFDLLLRGLLTREPDKRWGYQQVRCWLDGQRDIAEFYFRPQEEKQIYQVPFSTDDRKFYSLPELLESFIENETAWQDAIVYMQRRYISKWLSKNDQYGLALRIEKIFERSDIDPDLALMKVIYTFNNTLPFAIYGKLITPQNLYIYAARVIQGVETNAERLVIDSLLCGKLLEYYALYVTCTQKNDNAMYQLLENLTKTFSKEISYENKLQQVLVLNVLLEPDKYIMPASIKQDMFNKVDFIDLHRNCFIKRDEYSAVADNFILPDDIRHDILSNEFENYKRGVQKLRDLQDNELLITADYFKGLFAKYLIPQEINEGIHGHSVAQYTEAIQQLNELQEHMLLLDKDEYSELQKKYVIPVEINEGIINIQSATFKKAVSNLRDLQRDNLLLTQADIKKHANEHPEIFDYIDGKTDPPEEGYTLQLRTIIARNWIKRLTNKNNYLQRYIALSRFIKGNVEVSRIPLLKRLSKELDEALNYITQDDNYLYGSTNHQYIALKKLKAYIESLVEARVTWEGYDRVITDELFDEISSMSRAIERKAEQIGRGKGFFWNMVTEAIKGTLDENTFNNVCIDVYVRHQARIDYVLIKTTYKQEEQDKHLSNS